MSKEVAKAFTQASSSLSAIFRRPNEAVSTAPQPNDDYEDPWDAPFYDDDDAEERAAISNELGPGYEAEHAEPPSEPDWLLNQDEDPEWVNDRVVYVEQDVFDQIHSEVMPVVDETEQRAYGLLREDRRIYVEAHVFDEIYAEVMPVVTEAEQRAYGLLREDRVIFVEAHVFDEIQADVMPVVGEAEQRAYGLI